MESYKTFAEFLDQRDAIGRGTDTSPASMEDGWIDPPGEPTTGDDPTQPGSGVDRDQVFERSRFSGLFKGLFKVVNPARPASPLNSRALASPFRKRLKSQVMGK